MNKILRNAVALLIVANGISLMTASANAQTSWRSVTDAGGCTWARVQFVNQSAQTTYWVIWNGRAAIDSTDTSAVTDSDYDWDGVVNAGETRYVWVYGFGISGASPNIGSASGTVGGYQGTNTLTDAGDGEWVVTIAADGTVTAAVAPGAVYDAPSRSGTISLP